MLYDPTEIINFDIEYNKAALVNEWQNKTKIPISNIDIKYVSELESKINKKIESTKIGDIRKQFANNEQRTDLVVECSSYSDEILRIVSVIKQRIINAEIGTVAYFFQNQGENVPVHTDFPYRKNSLLLIPLFGEATTFYKDSNSYIITKPVIMNVNKPHGVRDVREDRLSLHIEIPNLTTEQIYESLYHE